MSLILRRLLPALCLSATVAATATPPSAPKAPTHPALDPRAAVPPAVHRSAFDTYQPQRDTATASWKASNDTVGRIGGWRTYAREAQSATAPASAPSPMPTGQPH